MLPLGLLNKIRMPCSATEGPAACALILCRDPPGKWKEIDWQTITCSFRWFIIKQGSFNGLSPAGG